MAISQILSGAGAPVDPNTEEYDFSLLIQKDGNVFNCIGINLCNCYDHIASSSQ